MTVNEAMAGYAHLYSYDIEKCRELISRPVLNLEEFKCPSSHDLFP
jgi:hypothetical protein